MQEILLEEYRLHPKFYCKLKSENGLRIYSNIGISLELIKYKYEHNMDYLDIIKSCMNLPEFEGEIKYDDKEKSLEQSLLEAIVVIADANDDKKDIDFVKCGECCQNILNEFIKMLIKNLGEYKESFQIMENGTLTSLNSFYIDLGVKAFVFEDYILLVYRGSDE